LEINLTLLIIEVLFLALVVLTLHWFSKQYGLTPLISLALTLTIFVHVSNSSLVFVQLSKNFYLIFAASVCIPVILMAILILYVFEGTIVARMTIFSILGASVFYYFLFWSNKAHLSLPGGGSFLNLTVDSPSLSFYAPSIVASLIAFTVDLFIIVITYQGIKNYLPQFPIWVAPGLALIVSLWSDTILYQAFCCGWPTPDFFLQISDDIISKTLVGVILWPLLAIYLTKFGTKVFNYHKDSESRPTLDLLFGPFRSIEVALARSEASLQESEALYQSLVEVMPMRVCRKDFDGRFTFVNKRYCDGFGLSLPEILGKTDFDLHPDELAEKYRKDDLEVMTIEKTVELVEEHQPIDGERSFVQVFKSPIYDASGKVNGIQAVFWDITERIQAEAERGKLIAELESRNAELERFTYTVSHDLKSPLITIAGFLGYLEEDAQAGNSEKLQQDISRINEATGKMKRLLDELLELSRIGRLMNSPEEVSFSDIVQEALEQVEGQLTRSKIKVTVDHDLPIVFGDRIRLIEVVQNLVDNAIKFIGDQFQPMIKIGAHRLGEGFVFFVKDNGIGIESLYHDKIFELFEKLDPNSDGTGIGLALVKRIVNVHGGEIWVESSEMGTGATFYFTLPHKPNLFEGGGKHDG